MILRRLFLAAILLCTSQAAVAETVSSFFVDLGADVTVRGVTRLSDGTAVLSGYSGNYKQAKLFEVSPDGASVSETTLNGLGGDSFAYKISTNGEYVVGASQSPGSTSIGEGTLWRRSADWAPLGIGVENLASKTNPLFDVSSSGIAVGDQLGAREAISWSAADGRTILESNFGVGGAVGVSDSGQIIVGIGTLSQGSVSPLLWAGNGMEVLTTPENNGVVRDISNNGIYISGDTKSFDFTTFQTLTNATIWFDSDGVVSENQSASDYEYVHLPDGNGDPFQGEVLSISDNGYAVGESVDGAFIWHESFDGVRMFDEWLLSEHGIDLPTNPTSINDVFFDGQNLNFAVQGSAYFVSANITAVPEPSAAALLVLSTMAACCRGRRKRT